MIFAMVLFVMVLFYQGKFKYENTRSTTLKVLKETSENPGPSERRSRP